MRADPDGRVACRRLARGAACQFPAWVCLSGRFGDRGIAEHDDDVHLARRLPVHVPAVATSVSVTTIGGGRGGAVPCAPSSGGEGGALFGGGDGASMIGLPSSSPGFASLLLVVADTVCRRRSRHRRRFAYAAQNGFSSPLRHPPAFLTDRCDVDPVSEVPIP